MGMQLKGSFTTGENILAQRANATVTGYRNSVVLAHVFDKLFSKRHIQLVKRHME